MLLETRLLLMGGGRLLLMGGGWLLLRVRAAAGCCLLLLLLLLGRGLLGLDLPPLFTPATWRRYTLKKLGLDVPLGE